MENPAYYTVVRRRESTGTSIAYGLFSSRDAASAEAGDRRLKFPDVLHDVAIVTLLDQDPASGTPLGHLPPRNAAGYVIASLTAADPARRILGSPLVSAERALALAAECRAERTSQDGTFDVAALTITDHDPAGSVPKEAHAS